MVNRGGGCQMLVLALERATDGHDSRRGPVQSQTGRSVQNGTKNSSSHRTSAVGKGGVGVGGLRYLLLWPRSAAQQRPDGSPRHLLWPGAKVKALESAAGQQSCHLSWGGCVC